MKHISSAILLLAGLARLASAAEVIGEGLDRPFASAGADGWSGVSILETAIIDSSTDPDGDGDLVQITEVSMYAADGRFGGSNHIIPILVDSADQIAWIGPQLTPTQAGHNVFEISDADPIDTSNETYRLGVWQWNDGVDDVNGGTVAFGGGGGEGMFQHNVNGTLGADGIAIGDTMTRGHSAAPGGRDYHIDFVAARVETTDTDGDGLPDSWETANGLDPSDNGDGDPDNGPEGDPDNDNLSNGDERAAGTNPQEPDTDMDGLLDGVETKTGTWASATDTGTDPLEPDTDGDGLSDGVENPDLAYNPLDPAQQPGTDPNLVDSDGDNKTDAEELADGSDPTDENDVKVPDYVLVGEGAERPFETGGGADGWSGVSILNSAIIDKSTVPGGGDTLEVTEVSMLAAAGRAQGSHHLVPLLINSSDEIAWIGPQLTPTQDGHNVFPIEDADLVDVSTETYRLAVWQWNEGVDDSDGGTVAFAGSGGEGMFQQNLDGTLGLDAISIGDVMTAGHSAGPGGRDYHIDIAVRNPVPPTTTPLRISADPASGTLTIKWDSAGGKLYNLLSVTDPSSGARGSWPIYGDLENIEATPPENTLTMPMPPEPERFFVIESFPAPPESIFYADFEDGLGNWTIANDGVEGTDWQVGSPTVVGPVSAFGGVNCVGTNLDGNYAEDANISLLSPPIDLTTAGSATLSYRQWVDVEGLQFDYGTITILDASNGTTLAVIDDDMDDNTNDWEEFTTSIPVEATGKNIQIEFRFLSDDFPGTNFAGWYLDDVLVTVP